MNCRLVVFVMFLLCLGSCGPESGSLLTADKALDWDSLYWREKAASALLSHHDFDFRAFRGTDKEFVAELLNQPGFVTTTLEFNEFFLGRYERAYLNTVPKFSSEVAHAYISAREMAKGGDYWSLMNSEVPIFISDFSTPYHKDELGISSEDYNKLSLEDKKNLAKTKLFENLGKMEAKVFASAPHERCEIFTGDEFDNKVYELMYGISPSFFNLGEENTNINIQLECIGFVHISDHRARELFAEFRHKIHKLLKVYEQNTKPESTKITSHVQLPTGRASHFGINFYFNNTNSSTNFNRARAASVLKTFFCDDLTPLDLAFENGSHGKGRHATDPACLSCHYKLDPMAGFFRNKGLFGFDFGKNAGGFKTGANGDPIFYMFDDRRTLSRNELLSFQEQWKNGKGQGHWPIGYIRSQNNSKKNDYAAHPDRPLQDLKKILSTAPEVKRCLVNRAAEYFIGKGQSFDEAWIEEITTKFTRSVNQNRATSANAYKEMVSEMILSRGFRQRNPVPGKCYDFVEGKRDGIPCEISAIIRKHCRSCHNSEVDDHGIDLTKWVQNPGGGFGFPHFQNGRRLTNKESLADLLKRLSSKDPDELMPLNQEMPNASRVKLYKWFERGLNETP